MKRSAATRPDARARAGATRPEPAAAARRWARLLPPLVIFVVGALAYSNALHGEFVFDDDGSIVSNEVVHDLGAFLGSGDGYRSLPNRVVGNVTLALNYAAGGLDPTGYHVVNVAIHLLNALLVWALVLATFRTPWLRRSAIAPSAGAVALAAALLFVAHPLQTQAVTYVVQRFTSIATTFYLLAALAYARFRLAQEGGRARAPAVAWYALALLSALLAMRTKEIAFTLPFAIALYELAFLEGRWQRRVAWLAPILATAIIIPLTLLSLSGSAGQVLSDVTEVTKVQTDMSRLDYLRTELAVVATYLRLLVLPVGQNLDWDYPIYRSFLAPRVAASGLLLLALAAAAVVLWGGPVARWTRRTLDPATRLVAFGIAWFFLALSVESSVIPIIDVIFEHRVYLPSVGFFVAVATLGALAARRLAPARADRALVAAAAVVALVLGVATFARNEAWATEIGLWTDGVAKSPAKSRPHDSLGLALAKKGREAEAIAEFEEAIRLDPAAVKPRNNLGVALAKVGRVPDAERVLRAAIAVQPDHPEAWYNLGRLDLISLGRLDEAAAAFQRAIALRPAYPEAYANLAATWNSLGRYPETVRLLEGGAALVRRQPHAHFNLGLAHAMLGDRAAAERELVILRGLSPELAGQLAAAYAERTPLGPGRAQ
jgi:Flp pilus assembly protein TadD